MVNVALIGHGVVGSGVAELMIYHSRRLENSAKKKINLKYILDIKDFSDLEYSNLFIKDFNTILNDDDVKVVVEVMGGITPAYDFVKQCLLKGKNVVTSNKELVAAKGDELLEIALKNNVNFLFEASVGGGIPILRPMAQCLAANEITEVVGILNGTTNFILTRMFTENMSFEDALRLAQDLGYAERDPSADVDGHDACRKICILASLAFGKHVYPADVKTDGITNITAQDVEYADRLNYVIKLIGHAKKINDNKISACVHPALVSRDCVISNVNDVYNAVMVRGDATDDVMFYGRGAGKSPTASAVVADVIDCVKHLSARKYLYWDKAQDNYILDYNEVSSKKYVRVSTDDVKSAYDEIVSVFGNVEHIKDEFAKEIAFITPCDVSGAIDKKVKSFKCSNLVSIFDILSI